MNDTMKRFGKGLIMGRNSAVGSIPMAVMLAGKKQGEPSVYPTDCLTFASAEPFTIGVNNATMNWDGTLYYSTDTATWNEWDGTTDIESAVHGGEQKIYMRGSGNSKITGGSDSSCKWVLTGSDIRCDGNIENLLDYETVATGEHPVMADYCYAHMFWTCTNLTKAPELSAITLADYCYAHMFFLCNGLTTAPELPATTLKPYCYKAMFSACSGLIQAPKLPATTLADGCYWEMFKDCTGLIQLPELPATTLADGCYYYMFLQCTGIKLSETQTDEYTTEYRIPSSGTGTTATYALSGMFTNTGGTFTGTPEINTTYYTSNEVIPCGELVGYSYNGVVLPDINAVWTDEVKAEYPYATITYASATYWLRLTKTAPYYNGEYCYASGTTMGAWKKGSGGWTKYSPSGSGFMIGGEYNDLIWTSHDILHKDSTEVYSATTDPVPVYE